MPWPEEQDLAVLFVGTNSPIQPPRRSLRADRAKMAWRLRLDTLGTASFNDIAADLLLSASITSLVTVSKLFIWFRVRGESGPE